MVLGYQDFRDIPQLRIVCLNGHTPLTANQWSRMRAKRHHQHSVSECMGSPSQGDSERVKEERKAVYANQRPLQLIRRLIEVFTDVGDIA